VVCGNLGLTVPGCEKCNLGLPVQRFSSRLRAERILIPTFNKRNLKVSIIFANVARWMRKASSAPSVVYLKEMHEKGSKA
jgi:hypothetical protein